MQQLRLLEALSITPQPGMLGSGGEASCAGKSVLDIWNVEREGAWQMRAGTKHGGLTAVRNHKREVILSSVLRPSSFVTHDFAKNLEWQGNWWQRESELLSFVSPPGR